MTAAAASLGRLTGAFSLGRTTQLALLFAGSAVLYLLFQGTGLLPHHDDAPLFLSLNGVRDWVSDNRTVNPVFLYVFGPLRAGIDLLLDAVTFVFDHLSWIGELAIGGALGLAFVTWRTALLVVGALLFIGVVGLWTETFQTLDLVLSAVALSLLVGIPLGILAGRNDRFMRALAPTLDFMQIMPAFAYMAPLTLIFLIGPASAVITTMIYSMPPAIRITALGIRGVAPESVEAATSLGSTSTQILGKVQLPMARATIGLAVNQTIMMALSIIVIAALINAPGLGESILVAIEKLRMGAAVEAGAAIVLLAMILDRLTASASKVPDRAAPDASAAMRRRVRIAAAAIAIGGLVVGIVLNAGPSFPDEWHVSIAKPIDDAVRWIELSLGLFTADLKDLTTKLFLDPLQTVLTESPWWLVTGFAGVLALIVSGRRAAITVALSLLAVIWLQVWQHAMETLTMTLVAVAITTAIGIALGVAAARSRVVSGILRPINDAAQTLPAFVYLLPAVALFGPTRFTAVLAAIIYAVPAVVRLVEVGIRGVPAAAIEAATSAGASRRQMIFKVQLPMARRSLLVALNQGVVLVLAVVVIGGLVGAQALGFDVVAGFSQFSFFGRGMAAALGIVLLGVVLDRITQGAGQRRSITAVARRLVVGGMTNRPTADMRG